MIGYNEAQLTGLIIDDAKDCVETYNFLGLFD